MSTHALTALIASAGRDWCHQCAVKLIELGCDVHTASNGFRGLDLLRKHIYDIIVVDDSFADISPLEFCLTAQDLAPNVPVTLVAGERIAKLRPILNRREVYFSGSPEDVLNRLPLAVHEAVEQRAAAVPPGKKHHSSTRSL